MECATLPFTSTAYINEASAITVMGKEYAHHAMLNLLIDFLNRLGRETNDINKNKDRKNIIFAVVSNLPVIDSHAKLARLGTAKKRKNTGRNMAGKELVPVNLW